MQSNMTGEKVTHGSVYASSSYCLWPVKRPVPRLQTKSRPYRVRDHQALS